MTSIRSLLARFAKAEVPGAPDAEMVVAPETAEDAAALLDLCSEHGMRVRIWGTGSRAGIGHAFEPDVVLSTHRLAALVDWQPGDLTVTVEGGHPVDPLAGMLAERRQTALLPAGGTVGGVVATGASAYERLRYGPTRDRMLEVVLATGDGRVVRAGGRVVKNVTGFDIPRLACGSLGSFGVICSVTLKLWPRPEAAATVAVDDAEAALATAYRPLAVLSGSFGARVFLQGTAAEVEGQASRLGGTATHGHQWPEPVDGDLVAEIRVPPADLPEALGRIDGPNVAQHGVGIVTVADPGDPGSLRRWAEERGGSLVVLKTSGGLDPWGTPPATVALQRRVKAAFDPLGVCNPGILPGGV
ncbi:MAG TPA: FAD-binding oxidoreductase [Acidimicrobiia bacterium]|nr:FAD-binding oxidoreductase [Acidimicrobiia bacterium]